MIRPGRVIGLCGVAGSGKSTASNYLTTAYDFRRERIAGPLKDMMRAFGLDERHIEGDLKEVPTNLLCGRTPRHAMQTLGAEWGRVLIHPDLWTNVWEKRVDLILNVDDATPGGVVIDDMRFPNEVNLVRARKGVMIRIVRPEGAPVIAAGVADAATAASGISGVPSRRVEDMLQALGLGARHIEGDLQDAPLDILGGQTPRYARETLFEKWGRECIHPNVWSDAPLLSGDALVRFNLDLEQATRRQATTSGAHISERHVLPADIVIENDGGLDDLHVKLDALVRDLSWIEPETDERPSFL